jgi:hypothetical protein
MPRWASRAVKGLLLGVVLLLPLQASAGRRPFTWAYDTELVPEGGLELEQWLWARSRSPAFPSRSTRYWIWWGAVFGLTDHLELNLPFQIVSWAGPDGQETQLESFEADLRYRLQDLGEGDPLQTVFRLAYHQPTGSPEPPRVDANVINSYDFEDGVHLVLDVGARVGLQPFTLRGGDPSFMLTYDLGVSYPVSQELTVAVENFAEIPVSNLAGDTHQFIGPSIEWTRGRTWVTFGVLVGLTPIFDQTPHVMPRLLWAVAL